MLNLISNPLFQRLTALLSVIGSQKLHQSDADYFRSLLQAIVPQPTDIIPFV